MKLRGTATPQRKCEGKPAETYPGVSLGSSVQTASGGCLVSDQEVATQTVSVVNYSLLTYKVAFRSVCDGRYLHYHQPAGAKQDATTGCQDCMGDTWQDTVTVPFRWDGTPRSSTATNCLAVAPESRSSTDQAISISLWCYPAQYAPAGPFMIALQVDTDAK